MAHFKNENCYIVKEPKSSVGKSLNFSHKIIKAKPKLKIAKKLIINFCHKKYLNYVNNEKVKEEKTFFGNSSDYHENGNQSNTLNISLGETLNSPNVVDCIRSKNPDLFVVMGTSLLRKELISLPSLGILNLHTGISPYYRGGMTNLWPIVNFEPQFCGVTIHELDHKIDAGKIIYTDRPKINANDNFSSINSKSIMLGTKLIIKSIEKIFDSKSICGLKQWTKGKVYHNIDYNGLIAKKYFNNINDGVIKNFYNYTFEEFGKIKQPKLVNKYFE